MPKVETITGAEIRVGDVIKSAAMGRPHKVIKARESSTGNTMEINDAWRVGKVSKVKRYVEEPVREVPMRYEAQVDLMLAELYGVKADLEIRMGWDADTLRRIAGDKPSGQGSRKRWTMTLAEAVTKVEQMLEEHGDDHRFGMGSGYDERQARRALDRLELTRADLEWVLIRIHELDVLWDGWSRFFLVTSSAGHVHKNMQCHTCRPTTTYGWLPHLSGLTEYEAVAELGPTLCSVCFASAPVEMVGGKITKAEAERRAAR